MNTLEATAERYSYRGKYQSIPIPRKHLLKIIEAGCAAPSGCNMQTTSFIAVDDPEVLAKLHACLRKPLGSTAPAMICVLTRKISSYHNRSFYIQDYSAAIENMLLIITDLGYASCWIEGYVTDEHQIGRKLATVLGVPEEYDVVAYLPVGIPAEEGKRGKKKPLADRAWFNCFGNSME